MNGGLQLIDEGLFPIRAAKTDAVTCNPYAVHDVHPSQLFHLVSLTIPAHPPQDHHPPPHERQRNVELFGQLPVPAKVTHPIQDQPGGGQEVGRPAERAGLVLGNIVPVVALRPQHNPGAEPGAGELGPGRREVVAELLRQDAVALRTPQGLVQHHNIQAPPPVVVVAPSYPLPRRGETSFLQPDPLLFRDTHEPGPLVHHPNPSLRGPLFVVSAPYPGLAWWRGGGHKPFLTASSCFSRTSSTV